MSASAPSFRQIISETTNIIKARYRHFLALSVIFILPSSIYTVIYPSLLLHDYPINSTHHNIRAQYHKSLYFFFPTTSDPTNPLAFQILYTIFVYFFSMCATVSITYSTFHGYYNRPVKLIESLKSVVSSFIPLIGTLLIVHFIIGFNNPFFHLMSMLNPHSANYMVFLIFLIAVLVSGALIFLQSEWYLFKVVVVVESQWGVQPLRRSSILVKGMKRIVFFMLSIFEYFSVFLSILFSSKVTDGVVVTGWASWEVVLQTVAYTGFLAILSLYGVVGNTILFIHCKALREKESDDHDPEEYVRLSNEDEKVASDVNVV